MITSEWHAMCAEIAKEIEDATEIGLTIEYIQLSPVAAEYIAKHPKGTHFSNDDVGYHAAFGEPIQTLIGKVPRYYEFRLGLQRKDKLYLILYSWQRPVPNGETVFKVHVQGTVER